MNLWRYWRFRKKQRCRPSKWWTNNTRNRKSTFCWSCFSL